MHFTKLHGLGNDFIVLDRRTDGAWTTPARARALCDRNRGVGADGVLELTTTDTERVRLVIYNADGSRPEMCGNGVRCVGRYLYDRGEPAPYQLDTDAGLRVIHPVEGGALFRVEMGPAESHGHPTAEGHRGHLLDLGNPHFVMFGSWPPDAPGRLGPQLETSSTFAAGANISFAEPQADGRIKLTVWERGCGLTQACGTGACAVATAAWMDGIVPAGQPVHIDLPGGPLTISGHPAALTMTGPAVAVFSGTWSNAAH